METNTSSELIIELISSISKLPGTMTLIRILQTAGILLIVYLIFLIFRWIIQYKRFRDTKNIRESVDRIEETLARIENKISSASKKTKTKKKD